MKQDFQTLPLPDLAHLPGLNARPDLMFLESISAYAQPVTLEHNWNTNLPWLYGIRLFNGGFYWEAHEVWETVWMKARPNSHEKQFLQGVIHFANGLLKLKMQRAKAAARLFDLSSQCIKQAIARREVQNQETYMGLVLPPLIDGIAKSKDSQPSEIHQIRLFCEL